jgi:hypothetical protein
MAISLFFIIILNIKFKLFLHASNVKVHVDLYLNKRFTKKKRIFFV